jgi:hypothetical protein
MTTPTVEEFAEMFKAFKPVVPTEFRLYYNDEGDPLFYTCEKPDGKYITVSSNVYFANRMDVKVIDGKIKYLADYITLSKFSPGTAGIKCAKEDINIIVSDDYDGETITWDVEINEFKNS